MNLEPILAVWGGLYLDGEVVSQGDLQAYIEDTLNELEFLMVSLKRPALHLRGSGCLHVLLFG